MRILITGAGGFIGQRMVSMLLERGMVRDRSGNDARISKLLLLDTYLPAISDPRIEYLKGNITDPDILQQLSAWKPDSIFHLAAVLTSEAERDPAHALSVNVSALTSLIEAVGSTSNPPRLIFPSSIAVFGGLLPDHVDDDHVRLPQTSYGTHKAIAELILTDASRHGLIDSRALRLPIVLVHPGPATSSVSDRIAAIVRDCVATGHAICPLRAETRVPVASIRTVISNMIELHDLECGKVGGRRALNQPALTVSMQDIADALARVLDKEPVIEFAPDPALKSIVDGWPTGFISRRAANLGIVTDKNFEDIVADYIHTSRLKKTGT